jgi:hypothetical protein
VLWLRPFSCRHALSRLSCASNWVRCRAWLAAPGSTSELVDASQACANRLLDAVANTVTVPSARRSVNWLTSNAEGGRRLQRGQEGLLLLYDAGRRVAHAHPLA